MNLKPWMYCVVIIVVGNSCTAYQYSVKANEDTQLTRSDVTNISDSDKVFVKLRTGQSLKGEVNELNDEYFTVLYKKDKKQTLYYQQLSKVKYKQDKPMTVLKTTGCVVGSLAGVTMLLWVLFPPEYDFGGISF